MIRFVVPLPTPSLNESIRWHWARRKRHQSQWSIVVSMVAADAPIAKGKRAVTIERVGKRLLDKDNLVGGVKDVVDSLKVNDLILDDDAKNLDLTVLQRKTAKNEKPHTVITITEAT